MARLRKSRATAQLILINAQLYAKDRERQIDRYRFSIATLRKLAGRELLRKTFMADLEEDLAALGWILVELGGEFAVMNIAKVDSWVKLSSKRLVEQGCMKLDDEELETRFSELFPPENGEDESSAD